MEMPFPHLALGGRWQGDHGDTCQPTRSCWTSQSKQERFSINGGQVNEDEELDVVAGCCRTTRILDWMASSFDWSEHWDHSDQSDNRHSSGQGTLQLRVSSGRLSRAQ